MKGDGDQIDYGMRVYDPRIGRWLSLDPLQAKYPNESPYVYVSGNPLLYSDKEGKEKIITIKTYHKDGSVTVIRKTNKDFFIHNSEWADKSAINGLPSLSFKGTRESVYENYSIDENTKTIKSEVKTKVEETFGNPFSYLSDLSIGDQSGKEKYGYVLFGSAHDMEINKGNERAAAESEVLDIDKLISTLQFMRDVPTKEFGNPDLKDLIKGDNIKEAFEKVDNLVKGLDPLATANAGYLPTGQKDLPPDIFKQIPSGSEPEKRHVNDTIRVPNKNGQSGVGSVWYKNKDTTIYYLAVPQQK